jgi:hypothetical protein
MAYHLLCRGQHGEVERGGCGEVQWVWRYFKLYNALHWTISSDLACSSLLPCDSEDDLSTLGHRLRCSRALALTAVCACRAVKGALQLRGLRNPATEMTRGSRRAALNVKSHGVRVLLVPPLQR